MYGTCQSRRGIRTQSAPEIPRFIVSKSDSGMVGVIDSTGKTLIPCIYDGILEVYSSQTIIAKKAGRWGLIDLANKRVTPFIYDRIDRFSYGGRAAFRREDTTGYLTEEGKEVSDAP